MPGRMVVSRRVSIDAPAPSGPNISTLWTHASIGFHLLLNPELTGDVAFAPFNCADGGRVAAEGSLDH